MAPDQDCRIFGFKNQIFKISQKYPFHFGDSGKAVGIFEEVLQKITSTSRNQIFENIPKMAIFHFGDSGQEVGFFEETLSKLISTSQNQQKMSLANFRKWSEKCQKFHKAGVLKNELS